MRVGSASVLSADTDSAANFRKRSPKIMKPNHRLAIAAFVLWAFNLSAQTEAQLNIQTHAGLTIFGEVGMVYSIEYVTDLTDPAESDWRCLEYLQLPASPYLWADKSAPVTGKRYYRAVSGIDGEQPRAGSTEREITRYGTITASVGLS